MPLDDRPSLTVTEAAIVDLEHAKAAMAKRMQSLGVTQAPGDPDTITDYDRALYGRSVRIDLDVCVPLDELRHMLNTVRAEITNALAELDRSGPAADRRFAVHRKLSMAKSHVYKRRQEIKRLLLETVVAGADEPHAEARARLAAALRAHAASKEPR